MSSSTKRIPELRPALLGGRALPAVRRMRVRVTPDGAVERTDAAGRAVPVAAPGEVARVLHVDEATAQRLLPVRPFTGPVLVLLGRDGAPLLALRLLDWAPPATAVGAPWLEVTGVYALARALDLPVEPAEGRDLPALEKLSRVLLTPMPSRPWPGRAALVACVPALVLGFACLPTLGDPDGVWVILLALLVVGPVIVVGHRARRAARGAGPPPGADRRTAVRPRPEVPLSRGLVEASLQVGPEDVVLIDRGRELWMPGPAVGGVSSVLVDPAVVWLRDGDGNDYGTLSSDIWAPTPESRAELARDLREAGLDATVSPVSSRRRVTVTQAEEGTYPPRMLLSPAEKGDSTLATPWLSGLAACFPVVGALGALTWSVPVGLLLLVLTGTVLGLRVHDMVRIAVDDRRAMRPVHPRAAVRS